MKRMLKMAVFFPLVGISWALAISSMGLMSLAQTVDPGNGEKPRQPERPQSDR